VLLSIAVNGSEGQRSQVKSLTLTFDRAVTLAPGPLKLERLNTGGSGSNDGTAPTDATAALSAPASPLGGGVTWVCAVVPGTPFSQTSGDAFTGSLVDGIYVLSIDRTKVTAGGIPLGADASLTFHRLFGDVAGNRDGSNSVNASDYNAFRSAFGKSTGQAGSAFDFDNSGTINALDFNQFRSRFGKRFSY
jgi:hypothetical protein